MRMAGLCQFYWRTCYILSFFFTVLVVHPHHVHPVTTVLTLLSYGTMLPCCAESAVKHRPTAAVHCCNPHVAGEKFCPVLRHKTCCHWLVIVDDVLTWQTLWRWWQGKLRSLRHRYLSPTICYLNRHRYLSTNYLLSQLSLVLPLLPLCLVLLSLCHRYLSTNYLLSQLSLVLPLLPVCLVSK